MLNELKEKLKVFDSVIRELALSLVFSVILLGIAVSDFMLGKPLQPILFIIAASVFIMLCVFVLTFGLVRVCVSAYLLRNSPYVLARNIIGWGIFTFGVFVAMAQLPENYIYWLVHYHASPYAGLTLSIISVTIGLITLCIPAVVLKRKIPLLKALWLKRGWGKSL